MADIHEHVNLELVDAGENTARVIQVLSKVKGLSLSPEDLVKSAPCIIAEDVPRTMAEKLQAFLEKAGAMVEIREELEEEEEFELELDDSDEEEDIGSDAEWLTSDALSGPEAVEEEEEEEEDLFSPDDFPGTEDIHEEDLLEAPATSEQATDDEEEGGWVLDESSHAGEGDDDGGFDGPSDDFGGFSAAAPASDEDTDDAEDLFGDEDELFDDEGEEFADDEDTEEAPKAAGKLKGLLSKVSKGSDTSKKKDAKNKEKKERPEKKMSLPKFGKSKADNDGAAEKPDKKKFALPFLSKKTAVEDEIDESAYEENDAGEKKVSAFPVGLLVPALIGFLIGALLFGIWGVMSKSSLKRELASVLSRGQDQTELQSQNEQLQKKVQQQTQEIESLKQQVADAGSQGDRTVTPQSISPSPVPDGDSAQVLANVLSSFETLKNAHVQTLAQSYETQKQASCARQVLLDGEGTSTYAQVVKKFSSKYTAFDVMRSNSLMTPFVAELKIPFKQEIKTGANENACNTGALKELPTPSHHEFGSFYGIWIVEYQYKNGKWIRKSTVTERNRALYEKAFKVGSPDYAKFLIDDKLYPGFKN